MQPLQTFCESIQPYGNRTWHEPTAWSFQRDTEIVHGTQGSCIFYTYHWRHYAYWLLCLGLLETAWVAQQHSVFEHVKTHDNQEHK